ncbi:MAG TPA: patatin family protein [Actinomycetaceae bacterium]|nr:patatin family protein [Actinomycetaceae bacterium]
MKEFTNNVQDVALIFEGGGMRASYTSGAVIELLAAGIHIDYVAGISAGSSNTANYLARDPERARRSFVEFAADSRFGDMRTFLRGDGLFNANYIYQQTGAPGQALPYNFEAFQANPARMRIGAFRVDNGEQVWFTNEDCPGIDDLMIRVQASSTMPVLMPPVTIGEHVYVDGALGPSGGIATDIAMADGYEKFLVILTQPREYKKRPERFPGAYKRYFRTHPAVADALITRWRRYNETREELFELEREGKAMLFLPETMPVTNGERSVPKLAASHSLGRTQARAEVPRWKEWLGL